MNSLLRVFKQMKVFILTLFTFNCSLVCAEQTKYVKKQNKMQIDKRKMTYVQNNFCLLAVAKQRAARDCSLVSAPNFGIKSFEYTKLGVEYQCFSYTGEA